MKTGGYPVPKTMRILTLILVMTVATASAQLYEVGVFVGGSNGIGDVGRTNFIDPNALAWGAVVKWNKSLRYAWRASFTQGNLIFDDLKATDPRRVTRGKKSNNVITEYSVGLEFNFFEYNLHRLGSAFTPYLYTGLTYFRYDYNYFVDPQLNVRPLDTNLREGAFAVPMTAGVKVRLNRFLILGAEIGARYTFTDNLDASYPEQLESLAPAAINDRTFGNIFSDDWYVFTGATLTYTFGRKPCQDCYE